MQSKDDALSTENNLENKYQKRRGRLLGKGVFIREYLVIWYMEEEVNSSCMHASIDRVRMNIIGFGLRHTI